MAKARNTNSGEFTKASEDEELEAMIAEEAAKAAEDAAMLAAVGAEPPPEAEPTSKPQVIVAPAAKIAEPPTTRVIPRKSLTFRVGKEIISIVAGEAQHVPTFAIAHMKARGLI